MLALACYQNTSSFKSKALRTDGGNILHCRFDTSGKSEAENFNPVTTYRQLLTEDVVYADLCGQNSSILLTTNYVTCVVPFL